MERLWKEKRCIKVLTNNNMELEVQLNDRLAKIDLLERNGNICKLLLDGKEYDIDIIMVEKGVYSLLIDGKSYNIELIEGENSKNYIINTLFRSFKAEIIDAETRYMNSRKSGDDDDGGRVITSPMPGKVVKILVNVGDEVKEGTTVIIVEAMKMQSEYKVKKDRVIKEIKVKEGEAVTGNQALIFVE